MHHRRKLVRLALAQRARAGAQVRPLSLELGQCLNEQPLGFRGVARLQAALFLALADARTQIVWHALAQPVNAGLGMLPGTRHCQRHVYHPCVPLGRP